MLSGAYEHAVDSKGRTILPARFRGQLGDTIYVTKGLDRCLWVFPSEAWDQVMAKLSSDSIMVHPDILALQRFFLGSAVEIRPDDQGRIALPALLREYASIEKDVVTAGVGNRLEIWAKPKWEVYTADLTDDRIADLGTRVSL